MLEKIKNLFAKRKYANCTVCFCYDADYDYMFQQGCDDDIVGKRNIPPHYCIDYNNGIPKEIWKGKTKCPHFWQNDHTEPAVTFTPDEKPKVKLTPEQIELLEKYNIPYKGLNLDQLLIEIDWVMTDYLDKRYEPTDDFRVIERLYDAIYDAN